MAPETLTELFSQKESNYSLRNSTCMAQKLYLVWHQKYGAF